ncbi:hypothetical protein IW140_005832 [Coemansia sp. RSA 1813]|nr:hypothetical protein EV178_004292 [Coemansia sp. RSA 1646]KAJ1770864.1 hypothetical protein LPJ74_002850 [Coemansia sp. RSA 1843]KAJ2088851.1 hypothetical protein IW138_003923 [Coemansia sp. RSA 986]KAJ2211148.1 hypothetical protein EV179_005727 [Coemansia sp. RSA 487]KAJ2564198.1 hypothetical protein IW140_005832 [Coemansia sp. RSA 1813]
MEQAFYTTLCDIPLFAGSLVTDSNGRIFVQVEKNNLNMLVYTDTSCDVDFDTIKNTGFDTKLLNRSFDHARDIPAPSSIIGGRIKLAQAHIIRLRDLSGVCLFVNIAHCLVDGIGYTAFVKRWAEVSQWLTKRQNGMSTALSKIEHIHDCSFISELWESETNKLDSLTLDSLSKGSVFAKFIAWMSPETRGTMLKLLVSIDKRIKCYFHISKERADVLHATGMFSK